MCVGDIRVRAVLCDPTRFFPSVGRVPSEQAAGARATHTGDAVVCVAFRRRFVLAEQLSKIEWIAIGE